MYVLRDELKNIQVTVSSDYSPDLAEALVRGRLDVAFLRAEPAFDLDYEVVDHEPLIVLMPSDHRLTSREAIHPREFVGEIFIGGSNKARVLRAVTEDYLRRTGLDIKLDYGVVPGCVHSRVGAYARLCEESAAAVRGQPSAGGGSANDRSGRGLQQGKYFADSQAVPRGDEAAWKRKPDEPFGPADR